MMRPTLLGDLNIPNLSLYYDTAQLANIMKILGTKDKAVDGWMDVESTYTHPISLWMTFWTASMDRPQQLRDNAMLANTI